MAELGGPNAHWDRYAGDVGDYVECFVTGVEDNLNGVIGVTGTVIQLSDPSVIVTTLTGSVVDSLAFKIRINLGTWLQSTAIAGETYELRARLQTATNTITWPDKGMATIGVK